MEGAQMYHWGIHQELETVTQVHGKKERKPFKWFLEK